MAWIKAKHYKAMETYFSAILDSEDDISIIREVLDMNVHIENDGEYISNLLSDMDRRGLSPQAYRYVNDFGLEWKRSIDSNFKFVSPDLNYQDFLDEIHTKY